jgi:hypothetical protein
MQLMEAPLDAGDRLKVAVAFGAALCVAVFKARPAYSQQPARGPDRRSGGGRYAAPLDADRLRAVVA